MKRILTTVALAATIAAGGSWVLNPTAQPTIGAAGAQESIYSILMMQGGFIGESAHISELDPEFEGMPIVRERIDNAKIDTVLSNSFGFGGTNATLVFQRYNG